MKEKEIFTNWLEEIDNNFGFYSIKKVSKHSFEILQQNELTAEERIILYVLSSICEDFAECWEQSQPIESKTFETVFEPLKALIQEAIGLLGSDSASPEAAIKFADKLIKASLGLLK